MILHSSPNFYLYNLLHCYIWLFWQSIRNLMSNDVHYKLTTGTLQRFQMAQTYFHYFFVCMIISINYMNNIAHNATLMRAKIQNIKTLTIRKMRFDQMLKWHLLRKYIDKTTVNVKLKKKDTVRTRADSAPTAPDSRCHS